MPVRESLHRYTNRTHIAGSEVDRESALTLMMEWGAALDADLPAPDKREELLFDAGVSARSCRDAHAAC